MDMEQEFIYHNESERQFLEDEAIYSLILKMFQQIKEDDILLNHKDKGDLFNKKIAFELQKMLRPPFVNDIGEEVKPQSERILLRPVNLIQQKLEMPYKHKYNLKERIRILFKGE